MLAVAAPLEEDADLEDADGLVDEKLSAYTQDMSNFGPLSDLSKTFRDFIEKRRQG